MWTEKTIEDQLAKATAGLDGAESVLPAAGVCAGEDAACPGEVRTKDKVIPPDRLHEKRTVLKAKEEKNTRQEWDFALQKGQACIRAARQDLEKGMANRPQGQDVQKVQTLLDDAMKYTQSCIAMSSLAAKEAALRFTAAAARAENVPCISDDSAAENA